MQNVNINQEVENAMMAPPQQPRGIVDLLASELKARDAKARNQLNTMMAPAPDPNTIISQNEKETENNVRQEIMQKMQSMAVKENQNKARMNQALAGIAGQRANNMTRMADGGIVGYADGGEVEVNVENAAGTGSLLDKIKRYPQYQEEEGFMGRLPDFFKYVPDQFQNANFYLNEFRIPKLKALAETDPTIRARFNEAFRAARNKGATDFMFMGDAYNTKYVEEMSGGGIVGYAGPDGSKVEAMAPQTPMAGQTQNPSPAYLDPEVATFLRELSNLNKQKADAFPQEKGLFQQKINDLMNTTSPRVKRIASDLQFGLPKKDGMAMGGIVGFQDGGRIKRFQGLEGSEVKRSGGLHPFSLVNWALDKGIDLTVLGAQEIAELASEFSNTEVGQNQRNVLGEVASGAAKKIVDALPIPEADPNASKFPEMDANIQRGRDERQRKAEREGIASLAPPKNPGATSEAARQFNRAAMQARNTRDPAIGGAASDFAEGLGLNNLSDMVSSGMQSVKDSDFFSGVPSLEELYPALPEDSSGSYRVGRGINAALTTIPKVLSGFLQPERGTTLADVAPMAQDLGRGILGDEQGARTPTEAEEIIASGPSTTPAVPAEPAYDPMKGVEAVANPNLRRAIETTQAAPAPTGIAAPAAEQEGEVAATQLASTVASNPTPQNMSRFESEIQRLMERRESPVRALSSFLKSFSQARGGSMGQNLAIATTAMNAADDAMDKQIIALEQLRRADQISERDFGLKQEQLTSQKGLLDAQASYYKNYKDMQVEIAKLKEQGDTEIANRRLYQSILDLVAANRSAYVMAAKTELGTGDMFSPEVTERANKMIKQAVETEYRDAQRFFDLPETGGAGLGADVRSELETYVGQQ